MNRSFLLDSNILVDYLRNRPEAVEFFDALSAAPKISAITVAELYAGVREGREREILDQLVSDIEVVDVDNEIAVMGGLLRRQYLKSHGLEIADAIIAATARREGAEMVTLNKKHFPMFSNISVPYERN
jgi:predicted nucleic acid-binding protein